MSRNIIRIAYNVHNIQHCQLELVSKELNHLAAILHVYAGGLNFMYIVCYSYNITRHTLRNYSDLK